MKMYFITKELPNGADFDITNERPTDEELDDIRYVGTDFAMLTMATYIVEQLPLNEHGLFPSVEEILFFAEESKNKNDSGRQEAIVDYYNSKSSDEIDK